MRQPTSTAEGQISDSISQTAGIEAQTESRATSMAVKATGGSSIPAKSSNGSATAAAASQAISPGYSHHVGFVSKRSMISVVIALVIRFLFDL